MDLEIHDVDFDETVTRATGALAAGRSFVIATPNVDYVIRAHRDPIFCRAINAADLRVPDGMWIVRASRIAGTPLRATVTGRLLIPALAAFAASSDIPVALVGGPPGVAERAAAELTRRFPGLRIVLATAPQMGFVVGSVEDARLVEAVKRSGAQLVLVALGAPRQERWMAEHRRELEGCVLVGIGAGLDIVAGRFREAPRWMTRAGLEWAFRLVQEPRRLARRYLVDDPAIFVWALRERIRSRS